MISNWKANSRRFRFSGCTQNPDTCLDSNKRCVNVENVYKKFNEIFNASAQVPASAYKCLPKLENIFDDIDNYLSYLHNVASEHNLSEVEQILVEFVTEWHNAAPSIRHGM